MPRLELKREKNQLGSAVKRAAVQQGAKRLGRDANAHAEREGFESFERRWQQLYAACELAHPRSEIWLEMDRIALSAGARESSGVGRSLGSGWAARSRPP